MKTGKEIMPSVSENKPLISVVVPVYNVQMYLDRCVHSLVGQTYENIEILLIDDGSTDNSPCMCDRWAQQDGRIRVVHKQNAGLGMARNSGLEIAVGQYAMFVDSDDYIVPFAVEHAYEQMRKTQAQVVCYGFAEVDSAGNEIVCIAPSPVQTVFDGNEVQQHLLPALIFPDVVEDGGDWHLALSACFMLFSMELIRRANWRFVSEREIISEDTYSLLKLYKHVQKAVVLPESLYYYCENQASLSHAYRSDRYEKNRIFYDRCAELCEEMGYGERVRRRIAGPYVSNTVAALKQTALAIENPAERYRALRAEMRHPHWQKVLHEMNLRGEKKARRLLLTLMKGHMYAPGYALICLKAGVWTKKGEK